MKQKSRRQRGPALNDRMSRDWILSEGTSFSFIYMSTYLMLPFISCHKLKLCGHIDYSRGPLDREISEYISRIRHALFAPADVMNIPFQQLY